MDYVDIFLAFRFPTHLALLSFASPKESNKEKEPECMLQHMPRWYLRLSYRTTVLPDRRP
jgi:hypothetical protein